MTNPSIPSTSQGVVVDVEPLELTHGYKEKGICIIDTWTDFKQEL